MNRRAMTQTTSLRIARHRRTRKTLLAALAPICALALGLAACSPGNPAADAPLAGAAIGGDFMLLDKAGRVVRYSDFNGMYRIVYFGYTFCPDVCPMDVQHLMQGYHQFARDHAALGAKVQPIFISIDPARDTPRAVGEFTANFGSELIGLTGTDAQVGQAAKAFAVYYQKREGATPGSYLMDHSRAAYLMGPDGKPIALLPAEKDGKAVAAELERWVR